jgi:hypothetical protein
MKQLNAAETEIEVDYGRVLGTNLCETAGSVLIPNSADVCGFVSFSGQILESNPKYIKHFPTYFPTTNQ